MSDEAPPTAAPAPEACRYIPPVSGDLSDRRQYTLAYFWLTGYFALYAVYFYMTMSQVPKEELSACKETLNYLTPLTGVVLGYFYTASVSGRRKDEALANVATGGGK